MTESPPSAGAAGTASTSSTDVGESSSLAGAAVAYGEACEAFVEGVQDADPELVVPACPDWTVHDLLAHQVHQLSGCGDGSFPAADALDALVKPTAEERAAALARQQGWIDRGIAALSQLTTEQLLGQWLELVDAAPPGCFEGLLPDVAVHLFDLYGALGITTHRDEPFVLEALVFWVGMADGRARMLGFDGLRVEVDGGSILGSPDAEAAVGGSPYEVLRTITGRRTRPQGQARLRISAKDDALDHLALYGWRDHPLDE